MWRGHLQVFKNCIYATWCSFRVASLQLIWPAWFQRLHSTMATHRTNVLIIFHALGSTVMAVSRTQWLAYIWSQCTDWDRFLIFCWKSVFPTGTLSYHRASLRNNFDFDFWKKTSILKVKLTEIFIQWFYFAWATGLAFLFAYYFVMIMHLCILPDVIFIKFIIHRLRIFLFSVLPCAIIKLSVHSSHILYIRGIQMQDIKKNLFSRPVAVL